MRHVEPKVFLIGKSAPDRGEIRNWLDFIGADQFEIPPEEATTAGNLLISLAGKRCYMSYQAGLNPNIERVRSDLAAFIDNILKVGHGSVLEHVVYNFALENVSRVFTAEMNRHRAGMAISEGSMRYIRFTDIPYWVPASIQDADDDSPAIRRAKSRTRATFEKAFRQDEENYALLLEIWNYGELKKFAEKKKLTSLFRRIIGIGVASGGVWSGNIRALRHIFTMRCSEHAEEEIILVASMMLEKMIEAEPDLFKDFEKVNGYWQPRYMKV